MKCHYEVLGVAREATAAELKTVYRKLALQWHPDKNPDNLQEAKEQFQSIQNAYEVLSDPQERAWYDNYRKQLLRGARSSYNDCILDIFPYLNPSYKVFYLPSNEFFARYDNHREQLLRGAGSSYNDCSLDVFPYFSPSCYKGFADDPQGFYAVYSEVFSKLASEETDYLEDPEDVNKIPKFGSSSTVYEDVHEFYAFWMAFSTNKSYVWLDQHEISQSDNRRVIKLMEKENSKIRQRARRERNEEIRRLVSFVRRRDKRVQLHIKLLQEKADDNKKKAEQLRRERIIQRQKEIEEAQKKQGESSFLQSEDYQKRLAEIENQLQQEFGVTSDDDTISEGGMESSNEDSSKTGEISETSKATPNKLPKARPIRNLYCSACKKLFKNVKSFENHENSRKHQENVANLDLEQRGNTSDAESEPGATPVNGREDAVAKGESTSDCAEEAKETLSDESAHVEIMKSQKKKRNKRRPLALPTQPESEGNDSHDEMSYTELEAPARARRNNKLASMKSQHHKKDTSQPSETAEPSHPPTSTDNEESIEKPTVKAPRTNKPKKPDKKDRPAKVRTEIDDPNLEINLQCAICRSTFPSKNKLFDHLKKTGHSIALPQMASAQKKGKRVNR